MNKEIYMRVSFLDGYLGGVSSLNGGIRQYLACAFITEHKDKDVVAGVADFYAPDFQLQYSAAELLTEGLKELEEEIQSHLIQNLLGEHARFGSKQVEERKRYLAFKVMDLIDDVLGCGHKNSEIFKFTGYSNDVCYTFFCIVCGDKTLNLQFNENYKTQ